ncbi:hypothetical protein ACFYNN_13045 [Streptomyces sp. NPDC006978]|uniref:hypothetical protein n=1 Tax=Streptomyces sp. NPDC006978 TaxID=3364769 RepID=UPI0036BF6FDD
MFFVRRSTYDALAADYLRVLEQRNAAEQVARAARTSMKLAAGQFTDTDDALGRARLARITDAVAYRHRITRLRRAIATYRAALTTETRRADRLQAAYDHAVGIDHPDVDAGAQWQQRHTDKPTVTTAKGDQ